MIRGDAMLGVQEIGRLMQVVRRLADLPRCVADLAKPGIDRQLAEQFANGLDPYGNPWAPLKTRSLRGPREASAPLRRTGTLRRATKVRNASPRIGLRLVVGAPYGYFHQVGYRVGRTRVPPRRILPQFGIPSAWSHIIREAASRCARKAVSR